jgi:ESS family glutamate:Na+ symporter
VIHLHLDVYYTVAIAAAVLALGLFLIRKSALLRRYSIPAAVVGGLIFAVIHGILYSAGVLEITFDGAMQNLLMIAFFCSVGFMASVRLLKKGGRLVMILLAGLTVMLILQNMIGVSLAGMFGLDNRLGLAMGSISLVGGHGTSAAFGPLLEDVYGVAGATAVAISSATFGLVLSGLIGGPLARKRINKHYLRPSEADIAEVEGYGVREGCGDALDQNRFLKAAILLGVGVGLGVILFRGLEGNGIILPVYLGSMFIAMIIRNFSDVTGRKLPSKEIETLGWICLSMFLTMALISMKIWQIAELAAPMLIILGAQVVLVSVFAYFIMFRATGSDYDSAAIVTAMGGMGLGTTSTAMANMDSLFERFGLAPKAYLAVPLVGSMFIDIINAGVITGFLYIL